MAKKGPIFVWHLSLFWVFANPARMKKRGKRGAPEKKGENEWTGPPTGRVGGERKIISTRAYNPLTFWWIKGCHEISLAITLNCGEIHRLLFGEAAPELSCCWYLDL